MNPSTEQLIRDYLNRLSVAARGRLGAAERRHLLARMRESIERETGLPGPADPAEVRKMLSGLGEPDDLVDQERARIAAVRADPGPSVPRAGRLIPSAAAWRTRRSGRRSRPVYTPPDPDAVSAAPLTGEIKIQSRPITARRRPGAPLQPRPPRPHRPLRSGSATGHQNGSAASAGSPGAAAVQPDAPDSVALGPVPISSGGRNWERFLSKLAGKPDTARAPAPSQPGRPQGKQEPAGPQGRPPPAASPPAASPPAGPEPAGPEHAGPEHAGPEPAGPEPAGPQGGPEPEPAAPKPVGLPAAGLQDGPEPAGPPPRAPQLAASQPAGPQVSPGSRGWPHRPASQPDQTSWAPATAGVGTSADASADSAAMAGVAAGLRNLVGRAVTLARQRPLETAAIVLLGLGGLIYPPVWLLGAVVALLSSRWDFRDKWAGLAGPPLLVIVGAGAIIALGGKHASIGAYAHEAWVFADYLSRAVAVLGAAYLAWRVKRGREPVKPPWNRPHRI